MGSDHDLHERTSGYSVSVLVKNPTFFINPLNDPKWAIKQRVPWWPNVPLGMFISIRWDFIAAVLVGILIAFVSCGSTGASTWKEAPSNDAPVAQPLIALGEVKGPRTIHVTNSGPTQYAPEPTPIPTPLPTKPPQTVASIIAGAAAIHGVSPVTLSRIAWCESKHNPNAYNRSGASGVMQFLPSTWTANSARYGYRGVSVFDPTANVMVAAAMIRYGNIGAWDASKHCWA